MMYDQYIREDILYLMFYAGVAVLSQNILILRDDVSVIHRYESIIQ